VTDGRTDRHIAVAKTAMHSVVQIKTKCSSDLKVTLNFCIYMSLLMSVCVADSVVCVVVQYDSGPHSGVSASVPVDQDTVDADEGIGEIETDVASSIDADASCPSAVSSDCHLLNNVTCSPPTYEDSQQHSAQCDIENPSLYTCETDAVLADSVSPDDNESPKTQSWLLNPDRPIACASAGDQECSVDVTESECLPDSENCGSSQTVNVPEESLSVDDQGCVADAVELDLSEESRSSQTDDVPKSVSPSDDDAALSEDSGSSQTLSVTQSLSLNDDDQGSLTDVTETAHSDDSGSSRTVEVGDDGIPQLLDDDEVDPDVSAPTDSLITDTVAPGYPPASSQSSEMTVERTPWTTENAPWTANETIDSAKDVTLTKESGENWDDEPPLDLKPDDEFICKYNYCFVQRSAFPLGYERSESLLISVVVIVHIIHVMSIDGHTIFRKHVCSRHGLCPSLSNPLHSQVAVLVMQLTLLKY